MKQPPEHTENNINNTKDTREKRRRKTIASKVTMLEKKKQTKERAGRRR